MTAEEISDEQGAMAGETLAGRYRLVRLVGCGGMADVYEAVHTWTERRVAVKVLRTGRFADSDAMATPAPATMERFQAEARAAARTHHPRVVEVLDMGRDRANGAVFMVQEFLVGEDLRRHLRRRGRLPTDDALALLGPLLEALAAAHEVGVIHRDVKPENIFLEERPDGPFARLIDFGIARIHEAESARVAVTRTGAVLGTAGYMAPEQARGQSDLDARADVWAMGVVLYEVLAGAPPFAGVNYNDVIAQVLTRRAPRLADVAPEVPAPVAAAIDRCLEPDREQRHPTMRAFAAALLAPVVVASRPPARRFVAASAIVLLVLGLMLWARREERPRAPVTAVPVSVQVATVTPPSAPAPMPASVVALVAAPTTTPVATTAAPPRRAPRVLPVVVPVASPRNGALLIPRETLYGRFAIGVAFAVVRVRPAFIALIAAGWWGLIGEAAAQTAEEHLRAGFALRQRGAEADALTQFEAAWALDRSPRVAAQVGLAHQALGHWVEADHFLRLVATTPQDAWVRLHRAPLDAALRVVQQHVGEVELVGQPAGAAVSVDGHPVGTLPLAAPLRVLAGTVNIELRADGYAPVHRRLVVDPGATLREEIVLAAAAVESPVVAPPIVAPPVVAPPPVVVSTPPPRAVVSSGASALRGLGLTLTVVGGAGVLFGVVAVVLREDAAQGYNERERCPASMQGLSANCRDLLDAEATWGTARWVGFAAGGALLVGGLSALLLDRRSTPRSTWRCGPGWRSLACEVRF